MKEKVKSFSVEQIRSWDDFAGWVRKHFQIAHQWIFRGHAEDWALSSTLERALKRWNISLEKAPGIEEQIIRSFRKRYRGNSELRVKEDTLYCLALMQHYGAPTRLLDWTYSPYIASKFALEKASPKGVVWCLHPPWCRDVVDGLVGKELRRARQIDISWGDYSFLRLYRYTDPNSYPRKFVLPERPFDLDERVAIQQSVFVCPGDISVSFVDNIQAMDGWDCGDHVVKLQFDLNNTERKQFAMMLHHMNVGSEVLFPGLGGFARSFAETMPLWEDLAERRAGQPDFDDIPTIPPPSD